MYAAPKTKTPKITVTPKAPPMPFATNQLAPTMPALGKVSTQATTIRPNTPHRTGIRRPTPDPRMEPLATCVVDKAIPRWLEERMMTAEEVRQPYPAVN